MAKNVKNTNATPAKTPTPSAPATPAKGSAPTAPPANKPKK